MDRSGFAPRWFRRIVWMVLLVQVVVIAATISSSPTSVMATAPLSSADWAAIRTLLPLEQQAYFKPSQVSETDYFGLSVAMSGDTVVVGAPYENSSTAGVQNSATPTVDELAPESGAAYVFVRNGPTWSQQAYLKASQVSIADLFGSSVAVSGDTIVVNALYEDSSTTGVQNSATPTVDEAADSAGAAYVFVRNGTTWSQQAYLKASQVSETDFFGGTVAVSGDTIVVGAHFEDSSTAGVQNSATPTVNEAADNAGAAYVFVRNGATWSQQAYLKASQVTGLSPFEEGRFGWSVAVSGDTIVVGATYEDSTTAGVQNSATPTVDELAPESGAAYVFVRNGTTWTQQAYLKASNVSMYNYFGRSVAVSGDTIVVGAPYERSNIAGVQNSATPTVDESAFTFMAGAAYVFVRNGTQWSQQAYLKASQVSSSDGFGWSVAVSGDTVVVGIPNEDSDTAGVQQSDTPVVNEDASDSGAVVVMVRNGTTWSQQAYLKASNVSSFDVFGNAVAVAGDTVIVGAPFENGSIAGIQYGSSLVVDDDVIDAGAIYSFRLPVVDPYLMYLPFVATSDRAAAQTAAQ
ncbi:MAG TPA: alpha/beta hydrolase [Herpetosiphon sp.]|uniref:Integrin alpha beta-propellor repeat protein n=1 Tax=Herpetosiphon aurantiacus (strain ATCC 23779 / DSM 785 / 114-95) TaxID=316274 RepID=A9B7Y0_HERA2|nr:FG-GAP repeat protein [Herpetosiphon sp.]ABX04508.1 Integrin alpha beta-propellor repeat protein [Herpetosiphon aurantiacus DSM 785]HBW49894.1 alpha/beta hydrolase [Herpetosiphon sp.]